MIWITGDQHFRHERIIAYCKRPFPTAHTMDYTIIARYGELVSPADHVIHVGDFAFPGSGGLEARSARVRALLDQLPAYMHTITPGNHDRAQTLHPAGFDDVAFCGHRTLEHDGERILIRHYPPAWEHRRAIEEDFDLVLHGHSHGRNGAVRRLTERLIAIDCGVDAWGFRPVRLPTLVEHARRAREGMRIA